MKITVCDAMETNTGMETWKEGVKIVRFYNFVCSMIGSIIEGHEVIISINIMFQIGHEKKKMNLFLTQFMGHVLLSYDFLDKKGKDDSEKPKIYFTSKA